MTVLIDGKTLTIEKTEEIARQNAEVTYSDDARAKIGRCREVAQKMVDSNVAIYGVTTGIGEFARIRVSPEQGEQLQKNIIYNHAAGTGDPQPQDVVRGAMKKAGIKPIQLSYKEGLGLMNGSQMVTSEAALLLCDSRRLLKNAMIAAAMSIDAPRA
ncbi:MAG: aromatic amino acid lyase [Candidatus Zixiibacteriota bacterium]|nr:MAG: aromatic amino acid lyase [candidate division Zixibacteria bacterium]